jgi:ribonucleotide reductase alpha subunit
MGVGKDITPTRQFSSCVLIEADDDLDSISAAAGAIVKYVSQRAGIALFWARILGTNIDQPTYTTAVATRKCRHWSGFAPNIYPQAA